MRDQDHRHVHLFSKVRKQLHYLGLHRHIERCRRFVRDQQFRFEHQRHRDHHPLALSTGKLMRILLHPHLWVANADTRQQINGTGFGLGRGEMPRANTGLGKLTPDGIDRVQGCHRLLEDHRNPRAKEIFAECCVCD